MKLDKLAFKNLSGNSACRKNVLKECQGCCSQFGPAFQGGIWKYNICHQSREKEEESKMQHKGKKALNKQRITIHS